MKIKNYELNDVLLELEENFEKLPITFHIFDQLKSFQKYKKEKFFLILEKLHLEQKIEISSKKSTLKLIQSSNRSFVLPVKSPLKVIKIIKITPLGFETLEKLHQKRKWFNQLKFFLEFLIAIFTLTSLIYGFFKIFR